MTNKERIIVFLLAALNFSHILDFMIMMPLGNYLMPYFKISPREFSLLIASYPMSAFLSGIVMAFFADRFERKKLLLITFTGFIIGTICCGFADSYGFLMAARIVAGLFGGVIGGQVLSIISDLFTYQRRGFAMGAVMSAFAIASSLGVTFSLYQVELFKGNWHIPFFFVAGIAAVLLPFCIKYLPELKGHVAANKNEKNRFKLIAETLSSKQSGLALLFAGLMMMGHFLIIPFINPYMEFNKGYNRSLTPLIYLVGGVSSLVAAIYLGRLSDKVGKLKVFSYCVPLSFIMVLILTNLPPMPFSIVLGFFAIWFILGTGRAVTSQTMISSAIVPERRGSFMSLNSSVQQLGTGLATWIAGVVVSEGENHRLLHYGWVGVLSVIVLLLGMLLGLYLFRNLDQKAKTVKEYDTQDIS